MCVWYFMPCVFDSNKVGRISNRIVGTPACYVMPDCRQSTHQGDYASNICLPYNQWLAEDPMINKIDTKLTVRNFSECCKGQAREP